MKISSSNRLVILGVASILVSIGIASAQITNSLGSIIKYLTMAYGITLMIYGICLSFHKKKNIPILYYSSVIILLMYTIMLFDTYVFHAISWFPGMIRYPLFSTYGIFYLIFILPGIGLYFGKKEK